MKLKPGDICITDPQYSADCYVIIEAFGGEFDSHAVLSLKKRTILLVTGETLHKIGEVSADLGVEGIQRILLKKPEPPSLDHPDFFNGKLRALREAAAATGEDHARWTMLARAKPGDSLPVHTRTGAVPVTFHYVLERGKKYVFVAANKEGKLLQYPLANLCTGTH